MSIPKHTDRLASTITNVNNWCLANNVELLDEVTSATKKVTFKILDGEYSGLTGEKVPSLMVAGGHGINWRTLTNASKKQYIADMLAKEGFSVIKFPETLGTKDKIQVVRDIDGTRWETNLTNFREGYRPRTTSKSSLGEQTIEVILQYNKVSYEKEYTVMIDNKLLRYDFYIPEYELFIEYHGIQHFKDTPYFNQQISLSDRASYDLLKENHAKIQGSYLMIPYTKTAILDILKSLEKALGQTLIEPSADFVLEYENSLISRDSEIAKYYLNHTEKDTCIKFNISPQTLRRAFKRIHGVTRREYRKKVNNGNRNNNGRH